MLRNKLNYSEDLLLSDYKKTGVCEDSLFNKLIFHVTDNVVADIMHDLFEGVVKYGLSHSLYYFINVKKKNFSLGIQ